MDKINDALYLGEASANIDTAITATRAAMQGYVAQRSAPKRGAATDALFNMLDAARDDLLKASREVNRLIGTLGLPGHGQGG